MLRRIEPVVLPAIVGLSTVLHWLAGRRFDGLWIMPDEAIYVERAHRLWHDGPLPLLHGAGAGYGLVYPAVAGLPLAVGDFATGYDSLKLLQAFVVSLAAVPVAVWARRLMPPPWPIVAAVLTLSAPVLLYSGLAMTEAVLYPVAAAALFAIALAVESATRRDQALAVGAIVVAVATHIQALVLLPVFALAIVVDAGLAREWRRIARFAPVWALLAAGTIVTAVRPGVLGSYADVAKRSYPLLDAARLTVDHAAWIVLATGVVPAVALVLVAVATAARRDRDPARRAFVAVACATVALTVVQVGVFASRYAPHLLDRDLAALPPVLFLAFTLWLSQGAPRPRRATAVAVLAVLALIVSVSWSELVVEEAIPDSFALTVLWHEREHDVATLVAAVAAVVLALVAFVPARARLLLPALVVAGLVATSAVAADDIASRVRDDQSRLAGSNRTWIDDGTGGRRATYLYDAEPYWNLVWQAVTWNHAITRVVSLRPARVPGPLPQEAATPDALGRLPIDSSFVVAGASHTFRGDPVRDVNVGTDAGVRLWRLEGPARLSTVTRSVLPNGDMVEPGHVVVYDCAGGYLKLTLLPKSTTVLTILLDGKVALRRNIGGLESWRGAVEVPRATRPRVCRFTILGQDLLGSTQIEFVRR